MHGLILILSVISIGGLIAYVGDKIGMKVGKNRLSIFGLRPKYTSIIITILTGILIALFSGGLMMAASERARIAVFQLDDILAEIESSKAELSSLRAEKAKLEQESDNLAHNLKLFGERYLLSLNEEVIYKKGVEVSEVLIESQEKVEIRQELEGYLAELNNQAQQLEFKEVKYNTREFNKLVNLLTTQQAPSQVKLLTAHNIFKGDNLVLKFYLGGAAP